MFDNKETLQQLTTFLSISSSKYKNTLTDHFSRNIFKPAYLCTYPINHEGVAQCVQSQIQERTSVHVHIKHQNLRKCHLSDLGVVYGLGIKYIRN